MAQVDLSFQINSCSPDHLHNITYLCEAYSIPVLPGFTDFSEILSIFKLMGF